MAAWVRNSIMLVVMLIWSLYILVNLIRQSPIETIVWGLPGTVYFVLNPTFKRGPEAQNGDKPSTRQNEHSS